jgi:plasmid replication initiation protein
MSQEVVKFIRKSNELVEAKYKFDIWETRIFTKMLTMIHRDDEDFKEYRVYLRDLVSEFGLDKNKEAYELIRTGAKKLMKKSFYIPYEVDGQKRMFETPVISSLDSAILEDKGISNEHLYIGISFHPRMKPYLLQLKSKFTMYDVRNILKLPSVYSIRIYELLKQYEKIGKRKFKVDELKDILGVQNEYPMYANFKQRVIKKAQKDLSENTDIMFTIEEIKIGRAVEDLLFYIKANPKFVILNKTNKEKNDKETLKEAPKNVIVNGFDDVYPLIEDYVSEAKLSEWLNIHGEQKVKIAVKYLREQMRSTTNKPENPGAYLQKLLKSDNWMAQITNQHLAKEKKKTSGEEKIARRRRIEEQLRVLKNEMYRAQADRVGAAFSESHDFKQSVIEAVKQSMFSGYNDGLTDDENLVQNPIFLAAVVSQAEKQQKNIFDEVYKMYKSKIEVLEREYKVL